MCLSTVSKIPFGIAYKIVYKNDRGGYRPRYFLSAFKFKKDRWNNCRSQRIIGDSLKQQYQSGFHAYLEYKDAQRDFANNGTNEEVILRIMYKNVVAVGTQNGYVVVCKSFKILNEIPNDKS